MSRADLASPVARCDTQLGVSLVGLAGSGGGGGGLDELWVGARERSVP